MLHEIFSDARFFSFLLLIDRHLAGDCSTNRCVYCGGKLDAAHFPRKPRGHPPAGLPPDFVLRFSFCCRRDGCRKRRTPPSIRFLDRKVYLDIITMLATVMMHEASPSRIARLRKDLGVDWHTIVGWRRWWQELFPKTDLGRELRSRTGGTPANELFYTLWQRMIDATLSLRELATKLVRFLLLLTPNVKLLGDKLIGDLADICFPQRIPKASS